MYLAYLEASLEHATPFSHYLMNLVQNNISVRVRIREGVYHLHKGLWEDTFSALEGRC